ncbi:MULTISPECIES: hypothetical protein [Weissella]|uniref:hypothetical protein n=1 Tax=Weissella TaxID=46255 RepID=UPI0027E4673C|nr:hypothetical protein [Weissella thailandensis]
MTKTYYDDFTKLPLTKMAQAISDITYGYKETQVPKEHYKKALSAGYEEIVSANVSVKLVETIYNMLDGLQKESPRLFYQALVLLDMGIKPSTMSAQQYQALSLVSDDFEQNKKAHMLNAQTYENFNDVLLNGTTYHFNN